MCQTGLSWDNIPNDVKNELIMGNIVVYGIHNPYRMNNNKIQYFYYDGTGAWVNRNIILPLMQYIILRTKEDVLDFAFNVPHTVRDNFVLTSIEFLKRKEEKQKGYFF
jgi:hypothetical protein